MITKTGALRGALFDSPNIDFAGLFHGPAKGFEVKGLEIRRTGIPEGFAFRERDRKVVGDNGCKVVRDSVEGGRRGANVLVRWWGPPKGRTKVKSLDYFGLI